MLNPTAPTQCFQGVLDVVSCPSCLREKARPPATPIPCLTYTYPSNCLTQPFSFSRFIYEVMGLNLSSNVLHDSDKAPQPRQLRPGEFSSYWPINSPDNSDIVGRAPLQRAAQVASESVVAVGKPLCLVGRTVGPLLWVSRSRLDWHRTPAPSRTQRVSRQEHWRGCGAGWPGRRSTPPHPLQKKIKGFLANF